jgi:hypothetical protein
MSLFDPIEDKKKKFNIFDYASTTAPKTAPVNQYQTPMNAAPADQYMTPIPKAPVQQFQPYNPVPNYTE